MNKEEKTLEDLKEDREEILKKIDVNTKQQRILAEAYKKIQARIKKEQQEQIEKFKDKITGGK